MQALQPILQLQPIDRIRRNHGLEHATIHVLSSRKRRSMAGYSDTKAFGSWAILTPKMSKPGSTMLYTA